ncbi:MAG: PEP-CTERM sorting domain-containing protein [Phycisphaerae bacterium]
MNKYLNTSLSMLAILSVTAFANASVIDQVVDGRAVYRDLRAYSGGITKDVDQLDDSVLEGTLSDKGYGDKTIGYPVFELKMAGSVNMEPTDQALLHLYLTQTGSNASGNAFTLTYAEGDGTIEYSDRGGTDIGTVDPTTAGWLSVDVTSAVQEAIEENWSWLRLTLTPEGNGDRIYVASSENEGFEPSVSLVPEPATLGLLTLGGLTLIRRRRAA